MQKSVIIIVAAAAFLVCGSGVRADWVDIETVTVGNPGNAGELSGEGAGGWGPDRICGAVDYTHNIGKYEVTAGQYCQFLNAVADTDTYGLYNELMDVDSGPWLAQFGCNIKRAGSPGSYTYSAGPDWADRPVNWVSYWDACRFANWLHNGQPAGAQGPGTTETGAYTLDGYNGQDGHEIQRNIGWNWAVTSEDEWYKAAYHKNDGVTGSYFDYPTSSDALPGNDLIDPDPGNNANCYRSGYTIGDPYYRTEVGEFENSNSPNGTFDQGGNLWEWNESVVYDGSYRGLRGGSFGSGPDDVAMHASDRDYNGPANENFGIGFRVSEVPEPTTLSLLCLGALLLRRRR